MEQTSQEITDSCSWMDSESDLIVTVNDAISVIPKLNIGQSDGYGGLTTEYLKNACAELFVHLSLSFLFVVGLYTILCQMICLLVTLFQFLKVTKGTLLSR